VLVTLLLRGSARSRVVAQRALSFAGPGTRSLCLALPTRARALPAGAPLVIALGTRAGLRRDLALRRLVLVAS
jgi:hypothetical protein